MKIAGRKNDGAWFRTNKVIRQLDTGERADLRTKLLALPSVGSFVGAIQEFAVAAGISTSHPSYPTDAESLMSTYVTNGIPRQVWYGYWSYDTYAKVTVDDVDKYIKNHATVAQDFGEEIREAMKRYLMARRELKDLANTEVRSAGNPGGIADATDGN